MSFVRRYWAAALILMMVVVHAAVIGYVRSRVARLQNLESNTIELGRYRFQPVSDKSKVYQFQLFAVVDPARRQLCEERMMQRKMEIHEESELLLRQVDPTWLKDPEQNEIRDRLMDIVRKYLEEPVIQRMLITDWLELPVSAVSVGMDRGDALAWN
ncbi:hypothetical protein [Novipirellula artificiosorum]|uniref:Uncharacterized protein n=1 Tax=Novipirellula artificiosorum TaxID=2528016 RepID=A0A5C6DX86_9BACT|nr:hypothetical protein [Novipirellula artificiosorum]TWU40824.1 hypothetical protein Poly41_16590 [Novipirellula artificiosorum]